MSDEYKLATDADFDNFIGECLSESQDWQEQYTEDSPPTKVWKKKASNSAINICKVRVVYTDVEPETLYDVLHDHEYRKIWDEAMIEGIVIQTLSPRDEVGYYSAKAPSPISNRDFCNQRSWRANPEKGEWIIFNHSVKHKDYPEKKGFVRAESILTGYLILRNPDGKGCVFIYLTQSDPKGWIPAWAINWMMTKFAPKLLGKLYKAAQSYIEWKKDHNPTDKPWLNTH